MTWCMVIQGGTVLSNHYGCSAWKDILHECKLLPVGVAWYLDGLDKSCEADGSLCTKKWGENHWVSMPPLK